MYPLNLSQGAKTSAVKNTSPVVQPMVEKSILITMTDKYNSSTSSSFEFGIISAKSTKSYRIIQVKKLTQLSLERSNVPSYILEIVVKYMHASTIAFIFLDSF